MRITIGIPVADLSLDQACIYITFEYTVIIFHFEGMSFSSAHDLKQWDFLDNNEIFSEFAQFIRHLLELSQMEKHTSFG